MSVYKFMKKTLANNALAKRALNGMASLLIKRGVDYDKSKFEPPELGAFSKVEAKLNTLEPETEAHNEACREFQVIESHHYSGNRHHAEHYVDNKGEVDLSKANLIDLIEIMTAWKTDAIEEGIPFKCLAYKRARKYGLNPCLTSIIINTVSYFEIIMDGAE